MMNRTLVSALLAACLCCAQAADEAPPGAGTTTPALAHEPTVLQVIKGRASFYGARFAGRTTASGETFDHGALTMAHRHLPFGTLVRVTNPQTRRSVVVRVNDRGPFTGRRVADLSRAAAAQLAMLRAGVATVTLEVLGHGAAPASAAAGGR